MESDDQKRVSRRRFLHSLGVFGVGGASGWLLSGCGGGDDSGSSSSTAAAGHCADTSRLSEQEKNRRKQMVKSLQYVENSPKEDKYCSNCQLYVKSEYGSGCGGCQLFPGPVNGKGYCNSWAPMS